MLAAMRPEGPDGESSRWQEQKSARTRRKLIEAGIDCLLDGGYSALSTAEVVERSKVSRGAMHHHFATRIEFVAALIEHVFYERLRLFLDDYLKALRQSRSELETLEIAAEAHWRSTQTREYEASLQLAVAARSDSELGRFYDPIARRFDDVWIGEMIEAFPQWKDRWETMKLANDLVSSVHLGLLVRGKVLDERRNGKVRDLVSDTLKALYGD